MTLSADRNSVGGYTLVRRLGKGGMAEVWLGRRLTASGAVKVAAIKVVVAKHAGQDMYARLFRREAELTNRLHHQNIVKVLDEGDEEGLSYIVMEHVDGATVRQLEPVLAALGDERMRIGICAFIVQQVLRGLAFAHRVVDEVGHPLGIVHRDVSPENILVSNAGEVKVNDWGVAFTTGHREQSSGNHVRGKPRFMAPEQIAGETRDPRIDLYAVGAVLQQLLDCRPWRGDITPDRLHTDVLSGRRPEMQRAIPAELEAILAKLLASDPAARYASAEEAIDDLRRWPGLMDMTEELSALCRSFTGVAMPRTRPSVSGPIQAAAAEVLGRRPNAPPPELRPALDQRELVEAPAQEVEHADATAHASTEATAARLVEAPPRRSSTIDVLAGTPRDPRAARLTTTQVLATLEASAPPAPEAQATVRWPVAERPLGASSGLPMSASAPRRRARHQPALRIAVAAAALVVTLGGFATVAALVRNERADDPPPDLAPVAHAADVIEADRGEPERTASRVRVESPSEPRTRAEAPPIASTLAGIPSASETLTATNPSSPSTDAPADENIPPPAVQIPPTTIAADSPPAPAHDQAEPTPPASRPARKPSARRPKPVDPEATRAVVHFRIHSDATFSSAQVRLAGRVFDVAPRYAAAVTAGTHSPGWRRQGETRWRRSDKIALTKGEWVLTLDDEGPSLRRLGQ